MAMSAGTIPTAARPDDRDCCGRFNPLQSFFEGNLHVHHVLDSMVRIFLQAARDHPFEVTRRIGRYIGGAARAPD